MKYKFIVLLSLFSSLVSATTVNMSLEKEVFNASDTIKIQLVVNPTEPVGGQLIVYKKAGDGYSMARIFYTKPSPTQCLTCARDTPLSEFLNRTFLFTHRGEGEYMVEANFGGVIDTKNFTVGEPSTSTTTSLLTTTSTAPATSSMSSSSTSTITPASTSTLTALSTTAAGNLGVGGATGGLHSTPYYLFILIFLLAFVYLRRAH